MQAEHFRSFTAFRMTNAIFYSLNISFMANDFSKLYAEFKEIIDTGTEEQARQFLTDHMHEFPEDMKRDITMALFEEGLQEAATTEVTARELKQEGIEMMGELQKANRILDDKLKVLDLQEKL